MSALVMFPQFPVYNTDGSYAVDQQMQYAKKYSVAPAENPVALAHEIEDYQKRYMSSVSGYLELEVIKGLKAKVYSGMQYISQTESYYRPSTVGGTIMNTDGTTAGSGYVGDQRLSRASYSTQTNLGYWKQRLITTAHSEITGSIFWVVIPCKKKYTTILPSGPVIL